MGESGTLQESAHDGTAAHPKPRIRLGTRINENAYSADGTLLLRAGSRVSSLSELNRLNQPDVRFGGSFVPDPPRAHDGGPTPHTPNAQDPSRGVTAPGPRPSSSTASAGQSPPARRVIESVSPGSYAPRPTIIDRCAPRAEPERHRTLADDAEFRGKIVHAAAVKGEVFAAVGSVFDRVKSGQGLDAGLVHDAVVGLLNELVDDPRPLASLTRIKDADNYTFSHSVNVAILAMYTALSIGLGEQATHIGEGALMHDLGKTLVPSELLTKQGKLSDSEWRVMRQHPLIGARQLADAGERRAIVLSCVLGHHERPSGAGYPLGPKARCLSTHVMVTSLADVYDALTTDRPYRAALGASEALEIMGRTLADDIEPTLFQHFRMITGCLPDPVGVLATDTPIVSRPVVETRIYTPSRIAGLDLYA